MRISTLVLYLVTAAVLGAGCSDRTAPDHEGISDPAHDVGPGFVDIIEADVFITDSHVEVMIELRELPATLTFSQDGVADNIAEYRWEAVLDLDRDGGWSAGDLSISAIAFKRPGVSQYEASLEEGTRHTVSLFESETSRFRVASAVLTESLNALSMLADRSSTVHLEGVQEDTPWWIETSYTDGSTWHRDWAPD